MLLGPGGIPPITRFLWLSSRGKDVRTLGARKRLLAKKIMRPIQEFCSHNKHLIAIIANVPSRAGCAFRLREPFLRSVKEGLFVFEQRFSSTIEARLTREIDHEHGFTGPNHQEGKGGDTIGDSH